MAKLIGLKEAVNYFQDYMSNPQLAKVLGVSTDQVYKYASGHTATCSDKVVNAFYDNLEINGEPVLIDYFQSEGQYLMLRKAKERADDKTE